MNREFIRLGVPHDNGACVRQKSVNFLKCAGSNRGCPFNLAEVLVENSLPDSLEWNQVNQMSNDWTGAR